MSQREQQQQQQQTGNASASSKHSRNGKDIRGLEKGKSLFKYSVDALQDTVFLLL